MKRIISIVAVLAMVLASFTCMLTSASAETTSNEFTATQTVNCKMGSYYTGDWKFLTNNTPPEEGNPFENQYMAEEANGKYLVVEVTLDDVKAVADTCPDPSEITLAVVAQSETTEWTDSVNGYPTFNGIGDTIKLSTFQLPDDYSVTPDEYWQFTVQLGLTDESPAKINAVKGQSKFDATISLKSYISDTPCLTEVHLGADAANSDDAAKGDTATTGSTTPTTTTSGSSTSSNSSTGFAGLVAIPAVAAVFGVVASKKRS